MRLVFVIVFLLAGCATRGICDYDMAASGWYAVGDPPSELQQETRRGTHWFRNNKGDFFACYGMKQRGVCGNAYSVYTKQADGGYREEEIVCTR